MTKASFIILFIVLIMSGCSGGGIRKTLGVDKKAPDEFMVLSRPPLSVPPEFNLDPPSDGDTKSRSTSLEAKEAIFSTSNTNTPKSESTGESIILNKAGADSTDQNIRDLLKKDKEDAQKQEAEKGYLDKIVDPIKGVFTTDKPDVIDPEAEKERLLKEQNAN